MKKILFVGIAAAAMLASCSKDETMDVARNSQAIQFNSFVNKATRATTDIEDANFKKFQVWGLMEKDGKTGKPFDGTEVTKEGTEWDYTTPVYWEDGYKYSFVAIAPAANNGNWTFTAPTVVGQWGSITFNNGNGTTDLIYDIDGTHATNPIELTGDQCPAPISFTFNHMLSRVKFAFENAMDDGSTINVTGVTIKDANVKATATLGESVTWTLAEDNSPAGLTFGNVVLEGQESAFEGNKKRETDHKYMIPVMSEKQTFTVQFKVTRTHHGVTDEYDHEVSLPSVDWVAGNSYAFIAKLDAKNINPDTQLCEIKFTATVDGWEDFNDPATELPVKPIEPEE